MDMTVLWLPEEKRVGGRTEWVKGVKYMEADGRKLDFWWWAHNGIYRCCIIKLYTWNQCYPKKFNKNFLNAKKDMYRLLHRKNTSEIYRWCGVCYQRFLKDLSDKTVNWAKWRHKLVNIPNALLNCSCVLNIN